MCNPLMDFKVTHALLQAGIGDAQAVAIKYRLQASYVCML